MNLSLIVGRLAFLSALTLSLCAQAHPTVEFKTNFGSFEAELYEDLSPATVGNFINYVREGYYRNTLFHRLVPNVLIQGGYYTQDWKVKPTHAPIPNEGNNTLSNTKWTLAMTHGSNQDSATTEFFINLGDNSDFDFTLGTTSAYYCVFGEITTGHDTVKRMLEAGVITGGDFMGDQPTRDLIIEDILLTNEN